MRKPRIAERIVDILGSSARDPSTWSADVRSDCAFIHTRYEALKLDIEASEAWRQAQLEWVKVALKRSGLVRIAYHFRGCPQASL